jgi:hypothetical protein
LPTMKQLWDRRGPAAFSRVSFEIFRQLTQLLDGKNARARPAFLDIAQIPDDEFP